MIQCPNCGNVFEGKFCPECGAKYEEKVCLHCGAKLSPTAKFCPECGTVVSVSSQQSTNPAPIRVVPIQTTTPTQAATPRPETVSPAVMATPPVDTIAPQPLPVTPQEKKPFFTEGVLGKIYAVLRYIPAGLFALYTLLLFVFFGGSAATASLMGEKESLGNVYKRTEDLKAIGGLNGSLTFLVILLVLSILLCIVLALFLFYPKWKGKAVGLFGKAYLLWEELLTYVTYGLFLLFLITSAAAIGQANGFDGGFITVKAGAGTVLILVFAIVFGVLSAAATVVRAIIAKRFPQIGENDSLRRAEAIANKRIADRERTEKKAALAADNSAQSVATPNAQSSTATLLDGKPVLKRMRAAIRLRRALRAVYITLGMIFIVLVIGYVSCLLFM